MALICCYGWNELILWHCCITDREILKVTEKHARVAQSVERVAFNHNVQGSSPCSGVTYVFFLLLILLFPFRSAELQLHR